MKSFSIFFWRKTVATYNTQQKKELMDFLKKHPERSYTIDEIAAEMKADPDFANPPGKSTIYRLMPGLAEKIWLSVLQAAGEPRPPIRL